jgi:hypothetical protein
MNFQPVARFSPGMTEDIKTITRHVQEKALALDDPAGEMAVPRSH